MKRLPKQLRNTVFAVGSICLLNISASAETVKAGMVTALSGPASALGSGVKLGVEAALNKAKAEGKEVALSALDDGYEPDKAASQMRSLLDDNSTIAVLGNVGTPTAIVTVPIANEKKTLLFGAFTGAGVLRKSPPDRYIINYRASYAQETGAMINGLLDSGIKAEEIAFFTQNDGYGDAGYNGAVGALKAKGFASTDSLAHGRYTRNTTNIEEGLSTILDADTTPKAVIMVGAYKPCAAFIKLAKEELPEAVFLNVSFVGSVPLMKELGADGEGVIVTQVVPHFESDLPAVKEYREALKSYNPNAEPGFVSLEGYLVGKIFIEGMKKASAPYTRESVVDGIEALGNFDIGTGATLSLSKSDHQASDTVWPTMIKGGKFVSMKWSEIKK